MRTLCHGCTNVIRWWDISHAIYLITGFGERKLSFHDRCVSSFVVGMHAGKNGYLTNN